jgi:hypothetical protein
MTPPCWQTRSDSLNQSTEETLSNKTGSVKKYPGLLRKAVQPVGPVPYLLLSGL